MQKFFLTGVLACLAACVILGLSWNSRRVESQKLTETMKVGDTIVAGLRAYHSENHRYPANLSELVPAYLNAIPKSGFGTEYCYEKLKTQDDFSIVVYFSTDPSPGWFFPSKRAIFASAGGEPWRIVEERL